MVGKARVVKIYDLKFADRLAEIHEIEWFRGEKQHYGAIDPITGQVKPGSIRTDRILKIK